MIKHIKQLLKTALGSEQEFSFEDRLVLSYILYGGIICFISIFGNIWLGLNKWATLLVVSSTVFYFSIYVLGRFFKRTFLTKLLLSCYTLLFCNVAWFLNYGSKGSETYLFLVYFFIMIFAWETFQILIIALLVFLNIIILLFVELKLPNLLSDYPSETARVIDSYSFLAIVLGFFAIIIVNVKNNYVKQTKNAQQSDKLKSAFLANMSHEIRTPLNAIIGFSQLLVERELPKDKKDKYSNLITENGDYLMKLISDILDISMIESGQLKITKSRVNLNHLLRNVFSIHSELIQTKFNSKIELKLALPHKAVVIEIDEMRLKQIIFNLINNAIKYTLKGHIKFGYTTSETEIVFFVEDTGCGIKEEFQPEIFNRFVRNEEGREVKTTRGAGIGLSLSRELVHVLGGEIWFSSTYTVGTTFYFSLPLSNQELASEVKTPKDS